MSRVSISSATISADEMANRQEARTNEHQKSNDENEPKEQEITLNEAKILRDKISELYETRAIRIDELSEWYEAVNRAISEDRDSTGELEVLTKMEGFIKAWMGFVDVHERFLELLEDGSDKSYACETYDEQKTRKLHLDAIVTEWRNALKLKQTRLDDIRSHRSRRSLKSGSSNATSSNSRLSKQSKRKEKMALAQLKLDQLKIRQQVECEEQELKRKRECEEQELKRKRELMETEMEAEQAMVSLHYAASDNADGIVDATTEANWNKLDDTKPIMTMNSLHRRHLPSAKLPSKLSQEKDELHQHPLTQSLQQTKLQGATLERSYGEEIVGALRQVVNSPKIEYLRFDGDPLRYVTFLHNFETCLERDNPDKARKLQLLIQHCTGKAREAIESCVNLPNGYEVAKQTLQENFGKPHVIAEAHVKRLVDLPDLKTADGPSLLELARHLTTAERTLAGMGKEYVSDLNHMNTLRELVKKLPMFLRARWTEHAGGIIESGHRPSFGNLVKFIKDRAKLVNNEFGKDMSKGGAKPRNSKDDKEKNTSSSTRYTTFTTGWRNERWNQRNEDPPRLPQRCAVCSEQHGVWRCSVFKNLAYSDKRKCVHDNGLCNKCLARGHITKNCPKTRFKCLIEGCGAEHHTLMHQPSKVSNGGNEENVNKSDNETGRKEGCPSQGDKSMNMTTMDGKQNGVGGKKSAETQGIINVSVAATGIGERRVCLGVIPVKVSGTDGNKIVETYALMDNGSEVTLCHEDLARSLNLSGNNIHFTLTGMTGSTAIEGRTVDIIVSSMDETTTVKLSNVKTVKHMPISPSCIPMREDLRKWPHLQDLDIPELENGQVSLLIGVKEQPSLFLPLEYKMGGDAEPVAIKYSLGWAVMGPMGGHRGDQPSSVNFTRLKSNFTTATSYAPHHPSLFENESSSECKPVRIEEEWEKEQQEVGNRNDDEILTRQLERLWKTDFSDATVDTKVEEVIRRSKGISKNGEIVEDSEWAFSSSFALAARSTAPAKQQTNG